MIHGPSGWQLELLKGAEKHHLKGAEKHQMGLDVIWATHLGVIFGQPPILRMQQTLDKQLRVCVPCVLDRHVGGILHAERVRLKNKSTFLAEYSQTGISQVPGYPTMYVLN